MTCVRDRRHEGLTRDRLALEVRRARRPFFTLVALLFFGLLSVVFLAQRLQVKWPWQHQYEVRVALDDARGIVAGTDDVRISGVVVGHISKVGLDHGRAVATATIDPKYGPLYRDARLRLRPRTPLEDMYLNVEDRGTRAAGEVPTGGLLTADRTHTPVSIGKVLNVFNADVRPRVRATIDNLGRGLGDHGDDFRTALVELAPFLETAARLNHEWATRDAQTRRVTHNFALISGELARRDRQVTRLVGAGSSALGELASVDRPLGDLIAELPPTLRQLPRSFATLRAAADELDPAFDALRPTARALPAGLAALDRLGPRLQAGSAALRRPLPRLTSLLEATRPLAAELEPAFARLAHSAPRLDRVTEQVVPCELPIQKFIHWDLSVGKYYDVRGVEGRADPVRGVNSFGTVPDIELSAMPTCAKHGPRK